MKLLRSLAVYTGASNAFGGRGGLCYCLLCGGKFDVDPEAYELDFVITHLQSFLIV